MPNTFWARIDSNTAGNPSLNLTVDDALQITFINEDIFGNPGDYEFDADGAGGADARIDLVGVTGLSASDFLL